MDNPLLSVSLAR